MERVSEAGHAADGCWLFRTLSWQTSATQCVQGALAAATEATVRGVAHWLAFPKLSLKSGGAYVGPCRSTPPI